MKIKKQNPKAAEFFKKYGKKYACIGALGGMLFMPVSAKAMAEPTSLAKFKPDKNNVQPKKDDTNKADKELVDQIEKAINSKEEYISVKANDGKNIETTNQKETDKGYISVTVDGNEKKFVMNQDDNLEETIAEVTNYVTDNMTNATDINLEDLVFVYYTPHKQVFDSPSESYERKVVRFKVNPKVYESGIDFNDYYVLFRYIYENGFDEYFTIIEEKDEKVVLPIRVDDKYGIDARADRNKAGINRTEYTLEIEGTDIKIRMFGPKIQSFSNLEEYNKEIDRKKKLNTIMGISTIGMVVLGVVGLVLASRCDDRDKYIN